MESIHPSLFRRQVDHYTEIIAELTVQGRMDLVQYYRQRLDEFKNRYEPWIQDANAEVVMPQATGVLILEILGDDYVLYPSEAPDMVCLFHSFEEAQAYAAGNYPGWEITTLSPESLPAVDALDALDELFD